VTSDIGWISAAGKTRGLRVLVVAPRHDAPIASDFTLRQYSFATGPANLSIGLDVLLLERPTA
jgi:hypothetical protein